MTPKEEVTLRAGARESSGLGWAERLLGGGVGLPKRRTGLSGARPEVVLCNMLKKDKVCPKL